VEVESAARLPELVARAFRVACQGRPGPVVIALPEDMLTETADVADAPKVTPVEAWPGPQAMERFGELLRQAKKPLFILGGSRWSEAAQKSFIAFSEKFAIPVTTSFRRAHLFPADHPNYVGDVGIGPNPKLAGRVKEADLLVLLGARMSEMPSSSYSLIDVPTPRQTLVHIHPGAEELGKVYQAALAIQASPDAFCLSLAELGQPNDDAWAEATRVARQDFLDWTDKPAELPGKFQYGEVMRWLSERLPAEAIICNGAGNYAIWIHRYYRFRKLGTQLAPTSGSMGYGVPAAVLAKRQYPDRPVVAFAGDGCFMMNGQEFATAVQYGIPIIVIVVDNSMYGTIRMHQERDYPNRVSATLLRNPDFSAYAKAFGGHGERVETTEEFAPAFERAVKSGKPAIVHCLIDPEAIT
ncbi:MAG: thiamine pyrophosphate-dependent enzyme, partial [Solimonas sp.]